jgi:hypothetical protein
MMIAPTILTFATLAFAQPGGSVPRAASPAQPACIRTGCSGELCVPPDEAGDVASICGTLPRAEAACYKAAVCAPTPDRKGCGWHDQEALELCLAKARGAKKRG